MADDLTQRGPRSPDAQSAQEHFERALRLVRSGRVGVTPEDRRAAFLAATTEFEKVLEADPTYPGARTNLGYCLIELGLHGDAKREIEQSLQECPQDVSALINYAVIMQHNQNLKEAESHLRRAMALDPLRGNIHRDLAYLLERRVKYRAAADHLETYLHLTPHANDERAVRQHIKLLRRRAGVFDLPDRTVTPHGVTADLRRRAAAMLMDLSVWAALWLLIQLLASRLPRLGLWGPPIFISLVFLYHLLTSEGFGASLGKLLFNLRVQSPEKESWYSPRALRETLKLTPILFGFLLPFPWNVVAIAVVFLVSGASALWHRQGQSWYDRVTRTQVIEWEYRWWRVVGGVGSVGSLLMVILFWLRSLAII